MGKQTETPVAAAKPEAKTEAKRKMLTPDERVAKLEAELKAAREKAAAKENKAKAEASEKRAKLIAKRDALNTEIDALTVIIGDHVVSVTDVPAEGKAS